MDNYNPIFTAEQEEEIEEISENLYETYRFKINERKFNELALDAFDVATSVQDYKNRLVAAIKNVLSPSAPALIPIPSESIDTNKNNWRMAINAYFGDMALFRMQAAQQNDIQSFIDQDGLQEELVCYAIRITSQNVDSSRNYYKYLSKILMNYVDDKIKTLQDLEQDNAVRAQKIEAAKSTRNYVGRKSAYVSNKPKIEAIKADTTSEHLTPEEWVHARAVAKKLDEFFNGLTTPHMKMNDERPF
jgi:DnaD/phage-associated family protein